MTGLKYKLAHKRAGKDTWSASEVAQRRHLVKILQEMINDLSAELQPIEAPKARPAVAKLRQGIETKTRRTTLAGRRATRQGRPTRGRLSASGGRRRH